MKNAVLFSVHPFEWGGYFFFVNIFFCLIHVLDVERYTIFFLLHVCIWEHKYINTLIYI